MAVACCCSRAFLCAVTVRHAVRVPSAGKSVVLAAVQSAIPVAVPSAVLSVVLVSHAANWAPCAAIICVVHRACAAMPAAMPLTKRPTFRCAAPSAMSPAALSSSPRPSVPTATGYTDGLPSYLLRRQPGHQWSFECASDYAENRAGSRAVNRAVDYTSSATVSPADSRTSRMTTSSRSSSRVTSLDISYSVVCT